jgi:hypothetical protein
MSFDLSATARCDLCGAALVDSDDDCDNHVAEDVGLHIFRRLTSPQTQAIRATRAHSWDKLRDLKGDDWIAWFYIGDRELVHSKLQSATIETVSYEQSSLQTE